MPPSITLCADGVSYRQAQTLARRFDLEFAPRGEAGPALCTALSHDFGEGRAGNGLLLLISGLDEPRLAQALRPPFRACYEITGTAPSLPDRLFSTIGEDGVFVSLTTGSAFGVNFCKHLVKGFEAFFDIPHDRLDAVELAVHEAVANAIIHGNLENKGFSRSDPESFEPYALGVERKIRDSAYSLRRLEISANLVGSRLRVAVSNEGPGFDPSLIPEKEITRGLPLIRKLASSVEFSDRGRTLTLTFEI